MESLYNRAGERIARNLLISSYEGLPGGYVISPKGVRCMGKAGVYWIIQVGENGNAQNTLNPEWLWRKR